jgi:hypothetical protein
VAYNISKCNKTISGGEFVKDCMLSVCDIICLDKTKDIATVSFSRKTITKRVEAIDTNLSSQVQKRIEQFKLCSITTDESTDISDTAQYLMFIRGIDDNFCITEELAFMQSLQVTTTGSDIFRGFQQGISTLKVSISSLCNITTDGAPNMTRTKCGFIGVFNLEYPENDVFYIVSYNKMLCVNRPLL